MRINKLAPFIGLIVLTLILVSACKDERKLPAIPQVNRIPVVSQTVAESRKIQQTLSFPALITAKEQANILAKSSGTAATVFYNLGDQVGTGDMLIKIDDISGTSYGTDFNAGPVNQAKLASDQAGIAYKTAQATYQNLLASTQKDLNQANIALTQAETSKGNTQEMTGDSMKTAQIAYDTAKIATQQAKLSLDNRQTSADQAESDVNTNADLAATSATNASNTIITGINMLTGFDESNVVNVPYENYLGALDARSLNDAKNLYKDTKAYYDNFLTKDFSDVSESEKIQETVLLAQQVKELVDAVKLVFDKTIVGSLLPQSSVTGPSLSSLESAVAGYQTQINGVLVQAQAASQGLINTALNNRTSLEALEKAYELSKQQEKSAQQNLENLKASSANQMDQAGFGQQQASNLYENTKIKLDSQILGAKAQLDGAQIQYQNSLIALNNLTNNYQLLSPISGTITQKLIAQGETINPGQLLFVVSKSDSLKIQFYVDYDTLSFLYVGMPVSIQHTDGRSFDASITALSSSADATTKRFLVEAEPNAEPDSENVSFAPGTITDAFLTISIEPKDPSNILLPISAVEVSPNGSSIYVNEGDRAKQVQVTVVQIKGESAELKTDLPENAQIVVEGNRLLHEGDYLTNPTQ